MHSSLYPAVNRTRNKHIVRKYNSLKVTKTNLIILPTLCGIYYLSTNGNSEHTGLEDGRMGSYLQRSALMHLRLERRQHQADQVQHRFIDWRSFETIL